MKTLSFLSFIFLLTLSVQAQNKWNKTEDITVGSTNGIDENGVPVTIKEAPRFVGRVNGVIGTTYTCSDLKNFPTRHVNKIASLTLGVQSNYNSAPIIGGAVGGTAYFVDGIRIRSGSLAVAGLSY